MKAKGNRILIKLTWAVAFVLAASIAPSSFGTVNMDVVDVGNQGNADDTTGNGGVAYFYQIGKYEVNNSQYVEFLNKVDPTGANTLNLYSTNMTFYTPGGINYTAGNANGSKYSVKTGRGNNPVNFVNFFDAMRFVNWLQNGQGSGGTETGVYTISNGYSETRSPTAKFWLPSDDEWYKAAYYDPTKGGSGGYWDYPMKTDSVPYSDQPPGAGSPAPSRAANIYIDDGVANGYNDGYAVTGSAVLDQFSNNYLTDGGAYTSASSYYGTFDQGGNVWEWDERIPSAGNRVTRGTGFASLESSMAANSTTFFAVGAEFSSVGFRIAMIPEPSTTMLLGLSGLMLLWRRKRRF